MQRLAVELAHGGRALCGFVLGVGAKRIETHHIRNFGDALIFIVSGKTPRYPGTLAHTDFTNCIWGVEVYAR